MNYVLLLPEYVTRSRILAVFKNEFSSGKLRLITPHSHGRDDVRWTEYKKKMTFSIRRARRYILLHVHYIFNERAASSNVQIHAERAYV